jgi:hypothetical protein
MGQLTQCSWCTTKELVFLFCSYVSDFFLFLFFFFLTFLGRIQDLFPYLFLDLFFLYFFSWVEDKKVHILPSSSLGEWGSAFQCWTDCTLHRSHEEACDSNLCSQWSELGCCQSIMTKDTRKKPAIPRHFCIPVQVEKRGNSSVALGGRNGVPLDIFQLYLWQGTPTPPGLTVVFLSHSCTAPPHPCSAH